MKLSYIFFAIYCLSFAISPLYAYNPENVFVAANSNVKDSVELAKFYCASRSISEKNIILLNVKNSPQIDRKNYDEKIAAQIFATFKKFGKISAINDTTIPRQAIVTKCEVEALVICKGVPFIISPEIDEMKSAQKNFVKNDGASVDSELTMLLQGKYNLQGFVKNPAMGLDLTQSLAKNLLLIPVGRLDGNSFEAAKNVLLSALKCEENGLRGRAYIDMSKKYKEGDERLQTSAKILQDAGFDTSIDTSPSCMGFAKRFDAPVFYFGWYTSAPVAYFKSDKMEFAQGASAQHIYSWSATNLKNTSATWLPNLISHKAAVSFGYVCEPFLALTHDSKIYLKSLFAGNNAGIASLASQIGLSWQDLTVADPLFEPLKKSLDSQLADIQNGKIDALSQYVIIRKMNLLAQSEGAESAIKYGKSFEKVLNSNFALLWKISQLLSAEKDDKLALKYAILALNATPFEFQNYGLIFEMCLYFESQKQAELAANQYKRMCLKEIESVCDFFLKPILPYVLKRAKFDADTRKIFEDKLQELTPHKNSADKNPKK